MDIRKIYTKELDQKIRKAIIDNKPFRLSNMDNGFIRHLLANNQMVLIRYNTYISSHSGITAEGFLNLGYESMVQELEKVYNKTQTNKLYGLEPIESKVN